MWFNILVTNTKSKKMITKTNSFNHEEVNEVQKIFNEAVGENQEVELPKIID